ncbi:MAG TPA: FtsX-like permease family protein [Planctomycetota bacterium]|jgi:putative ABC transport system permease protein
MNRLFDYLLAGLKGVLRHKLRSFLAVMGIVLAISALLSMLAVGEGARQQILTEMEHLGLRNIIITSRRPPQKATEQKQSQRGEVVSFGITKLDYERCKATIPGLTQVAIVHEVGRPVLILGRKVNARVLGVSDEYFKIHQARIGRGRMLTAIDSQRQAQVCLIGTPIPAEVIQHNDPLGMTIMVGEQVFDIVGTITTAGGGAAAPASAPGGNGNNNSNGGNSGVAGSNLVSLYMPFETAMGRFGAFTQKVDTGSRQFYKQEITEMILQCADPLAAVKPLDAVMQKGHKEVDYETTVPLQVLYQRQRTQEIFNLVLLMISGLTLLVGGVGIVNIMLVSVAERTKEIGIRRALGARQRDIMLQFLIETLALTMTGGALGVLAGFGGVYAVERYTGWPVSVTVETIVASFLVSVIAGVLFGMYPAHKASTVMPMVALRYE